MRPAQIVRSLKAMLRAKCQPVYLWGPPGVGKSQVVRQVAEEEGYGFIDLRAVLLDPVDLRGLPKVGKNVVDWIPPAFLPVRGRAKGKGIIFADELAQAPPLVQAALLQGVLDHRIGETELDPEWRWVAASNRVEDRAGAHRLISPLLNRFTHLDFEVNLDDWLEWASANNIRNEVRSFLRWKPALLHSFDASKHERAFPTPRSWFFLSQTLDVVSDRDLMVQLAAGTVGEGAAGEFISFLRLVAELPSMESVLANPETARVPQEASVLYAMCGQLVERATKPDADLNIIDRVVRYCDRMNDEYAAIVCRELYSVSEVARKSGRIREWFKQHKDLILD